QPGLTHVTLSNEERRVINMHRNLDRYLDLPGSDRVSAAGDDAVGAPPAAERRGGRSDAEERRHEAR
ncbi:MAG: hypothetical protein WB777_18510, partial [Mycobacterium sp.]